MTDRAHMIGDAVREWLKPDNHELKNAIARTVEENFFSFEDIKHRLLTLKETLSDDYISLISNKFQGKIKTDKSVFVFHPGNIPLCSIEDLVAVNLSGARYCGKLSRRDPWLYPTFGTALRKVGFERLQMNTDIMSFRELRADAVIFSGSGESVETVRNLVTSEHMVTPGAPELIRSTWYSLAFIDELSSHTMRNLTEAVFRYQGMGCRSVAVVISPLALDEVRCRFTDYIEEFWTLNPPHKKPAPSLFHRYAYNKAAGYPQAWLDHFLIEQTSAEPDTDFLLHWVTGGPEEVAPFAEQFSRGLQSVYTSSMETVLPGYSGNRDLLSHAQKPALDWRPDGIDTCQWLIENLGS